MKITNPRPSFPEANRWERIKSKLHLTPERIEATIDGSLNLGKSIAMSWHNLEDQVTKVLGTRVLGHPVISDRISSASQDFLTGSAVTTVGGLGLGLAGFSAAAGVAKLLKGFHGGSGTEKLEGFLNLTAATAIGCTILGVGTVPLVLGPIAAGLGVATGAVHAIRSYQKADGAKEVQGFWDMTRSATLMASLFSGFSAAAHVAAAILGPVATAIQACRGHVVLDKALKSHDKPKQIQGLADVANAVGLTLAFTGLPLPGVALMTATTGISLLYGVLPAAKTRVDKVLDRAHKPLSLAVGVIEATIAPVFKSVRKWIDAHSPWQHGEDVPPI